MSTAEQRSSGSLRTRRDPNASADSPSGSVVDVCFFTSTTVIITFLLVISVSEWNSILVYGRNAHDVAGEAIACVSNALGLNLRDLVNCILLWR